MNYLYHGSSIEGIEALRAQSLLYGGGQRVVYLTDEPAYALFYIWDTGRTGYGRKHVTAWIEDGTAWYEEQFAGQLKAFYQGASGWLYLVERGPDALAVEGREGLFAVPGDAPVAEARYVPDVYGALQEQERQGRLKVLRFEERPREKREELTERTAQWIVQNDFFPEGEEAGFFRRYFPEAWKRGEQRRQTKRQKGQDLYA